MSSTLTQTSWRLFVLHDLHGDKNMALRWFGMGGGLRSGCQQEFLRNQQMDGWECLWRNAIRGHS